MKVGIKDKFTVVSVNFWTPGVSRKSGKWKPGMWVEQEPEVLPHGLGKAIGLAGLELLFGAMMTYRLGPAEADGSCELSVSLGDLKIAILDVYCV